MQFSELKDSSCFKAFRIEVSQDSQLHTVNVLIEINPSLVVNMPVHEGSALPLPERMEPHVVITSIPGIKLLYVYMPHLM
jgi:hypothetical protein